MPALTRKELDRMRCADPACTTQHAPDEELFLHAACHPHASLEMAYQPSSGTVRVACGECGQPVVRIAVAPGEEEPSHVH